MTPGWPIMRMDVYRTKHSIGLKGSIAISKRDWSELKPAIIAKFPWNTSTPATSRARVKIVRENGALLGYVGPLTRDMNNKKMATKPEEALVLDIVRTWDTKQTAARIRVAVPNESYPFIGLEQQSTYWDFRACNAGPEGKGSALADSGYMELIAFSKIWTIKKLEDSTEELHAEWVDDNDTRISLQTFTDSAMSRIWMRPARLSNDISLALMLERF
ncbi:hypothetical protein FRB93_014065 [Tulasnella sp. JGI-2019a]|nr:hypothetical protein FRB93_014065 [Tulasnella sp. JGI-2019a]